MSDKRVTKVCRAPNCSLRTFEVKVPESTTVCLSCGADLHSPVEEMVARIFGGAFADAFGDNPYWGKP